MSHTFDKTEHLKSQNAIDALFATGDKFMAYPFRVVYAPATRQPDAPPVQVMVVARKRLFKHAVSRNRFKRLLREAYRLHKQPLFDALRGTQRAMRIAFVAVSDTLPDFQTVDKQMAAAIDRLTTAAQ